MSGSGESPKLKLRDVAAQVARSIARHVNAVASAFLANPASFVSSPNLTPAQRCSIFNLAMGRCGVGLKMPTDGKQKVWDAVIFERGMALAKGRPLVAVAWVHQSYQPVASPTGNQQRRRSFYTMLTEAARTGLIDKVDPAQFTHADPKEAAALLKAWYIKVVGDGRTEGTLTGTKLKPGVLAQSRGFNIAVRADLGPVATGGGRAAVTAASLLAEIQGEPEAASPELTAEEDD